MESNAIVLEKWEIAMKNYLLAEHNYNEAVKKCLICEIKHEEIAPKKPQALEALYATRRQTRDIIKRDFPEWFALNDMALDRAGLKEAEKEASNYGMPSRLAREALLMAVAPNLDAVEFKISILKEQADGIEYYKAVANDMFRLGILFEKCHITIGDDGNIAA